MISESITTETYRAGSLGSESLTKVKTRLNSSGEISRIPGMSQYGYPNYWSNFQTTTLFLLTKLETDQALEKYFRSHPDERKKLRENTAAHINSSKKVLEVLEWSTKTGIRYAYDAAVDLLAKCSEVTLEVAQYRILEEEGLILDKQWATLISAIGRAHHLSLQDRLKAITQQVSSQRRVVNEAVVEALYLLADEAEERKINKNIIVIVKQYLQWFASDAQADKFIQRYARDVLSELS